MAKVAVDNCKFPGRGYVCGKCLPCLVRKRSSLTARGIMHAMGYPEDRVHFLTLSYRDEFLPVVTGECPYTGAKALHPTLSRRDLRELKRKMRRSARKRYGITPEFLSAGEYGGRFGRPHYHLIVYGLTGEQLIAVAVDAWTVRYVAGQVKPEKNDDCVKVKVPNTPKEVYEYTKVPALVERKRTLKGYITIGDGNPLSIAYTCSYTLSGITDKSTLPEGVEKEFATWTQSLGATFITEYGRDLVARFSIAGLLSTYGPDKPVIGLPSMIELPTPKGPRPYPLDRCMREHLLRGMGVDPDSDEAKEARKYAFETREEAIFLPGDPLGLREEAEAMATKAANRAGRMKRRMREARKDGVH